MAPVELRLSHSDGSATWVCVLPIAVTGPEGQGPWLVHCALNTDRAHRLEDYLTKLAFRTSSRDPEPEQPPGWRRGEMKLEMPRNALTKRELEIVRLLAEDPDLRSLAQRLHLSYSTVRNHVQHILAKLGVHSISEAVACHILTTD